MKPKYAGIAMLGLLAVSLLGALYWKAGWAGIAPIVVAIPVVFCVLWAIGAVIFEKWWPFV